MPSGAAAYFRSVFGFVALRELEQPQFTIPDLETT
jgi:hypothetical protein